MSRFAASIIAPAGAIVLLFKSRGPMHLSRSRRLMLVIVTSVRNWQAGTLQAGIFAQEEQDDVNGIADSVGGNGNGKVAAKGEIH